jgi:1-acyl-sn-glycerol-3-phosphate acyltransferase
MKRFLIQSSRFLELGILLLMALADARKKKLGRLPPISDAAWLTSWSHRVLAACGVWIESAGLPPSHGLVVSNHISYLDVLVLSAIFPCSFVAKDEVQHWPVIGNLAVSAGTLFVKRDSRADTVRVNRCIKERLRDGVPTVVFPEGTSSAGTAVLPFQSSLLQPAIELDEIVTPVSITYTVSNGDVSTCVSYWGSMSLVRQLWRLMSVDRVDASLRFSEGQRFENRNVAALECRQQIVDCKMSRTT